MSYIRKYNFFGENIINKMCIFYKGKESLKGVLYDVFIIMFNFNVRNKKCIFVLIWYGRILVLLGNSFKLKIDF